MTSAEIERLLLDGLTPDQKQAVRSEKRRVLVVAGAGSGKTEAMARRIAWWIGIDQVPRDRIVAFTFTERAAAEMKFRIRSWVQKITPQGQETSLGNMYIGTIHGFCLSKIRDYWPDDYHNFDILDEAARTALIMRGFTGLLGLQALRQAMGLGQYATLEAFVQAYDQLHEHDQFDVRLCSEEVPFRLGEAEREWCKQAQLLTDVGETDAAKAFSRSAARYYAYLRCRRFLDFSTSQTEFIRRLRADADVSRLLSDKSVHLVVDEAQDINPVQKQLIDLLVGSKGKLTAVGDHRQAIYGFRGAKVEIIGKLWGELRQSVDSEVVDLRHNFRSTERIVNLANRWASTISPLLGMQTPPMVHGNKSRTDHHNSHVALIDFQARDEEAAWIADAIKVLVPTELEGARHDKKDGSYRGLALSDIAVLVRSSTSVRSYIEALETAGIPAVVRAGPDLFSQPETLFFVAALALTGGQTQFVGSDINPKSMPNRIQNVLGCPPTPEAVLKESAKLLRRSGLTLDRKVEEHVLFVSKAICDRISSNISLSPKEAARVRNPRLRDFLTAKNKLRRVFPQQIYHYLLSEACVENWDTCEGRGQTAMFHLGALSGLVTGIETPGWTSVEDYEWQIIGLCQYGAEEGRVSEQPLMVRPDAVTISTVHAVKGLEFAAVFLADVNAQRFPSSFASRRPNLPLDGKIVQRIDIASLADNSNHDGERRLMYVALTRAERFLIVTRSGSKTSKFVKELRKLIDDVGGTVTDNSEQMLEDLKYAPKEYRRELHLSTSFSDLRYYLACPHDFYLRKVLGFAPTIDQAFGYGRGVHNLLRAIHSDSRKWAEFAKDRNVLEQEIAKLIDRGLFYLRYTTGDPAENMRQKGLRIVADYVERYMDELSKLQFEPEKEFETLIEYEDGTGGALVSGAIDVVRQDDPPRVTVIDFKSGNPESDSRQLDEEEMKLQVSIYAVAARKELEYQPEKALVRYLGAETEDKMQLEVSLDDKSTDQAKSTVAKTAGKIRDRIFSQGPTQTGTGKTRCSECDFTGFCGMDAARKHKESEFGPH